MAELLCTATGAVRPVIPPDRLRLDRLDEEDDGLDGGPDALEARAAYQPST